MISNKQYNANFTSKLFKHSVDVLIILLAFLLVSNVYAEKTLIIINSYPQSNKDSLSKKQKTQVYIVSGTVTGNLIENPSVEIKYLTNSDKKKNEKKHNIRQNQKTISSVAQKVTNKVEKAEPKNYRVIVQSRSQLPSLFAGKKSSDLIVPARDYRFKIIECTLTIELSLLIDSSILHFEYYKSFKIFTPSHQQSHVRPPPQKEHDLL